MELPVNQIFCGSALTELRKLADESINCCISSPPYWSLRDYGVAGQLGLEPTFEEYINKLCTIYDEVKRVLRKDGTCWVNLGDSYAGSGGEHKPWHKSDSSFQHKGGFSKHCLTHEFTKPQRSNFGRQGKTSIVSDRSHSGRCYDNSLPAKSLCLIPQRFAIEMVNRGWILRNVIIWHKPNPMPSSAKDRFTVDFEYVYFFVKQKRYFFEPQYEPYLTESNAERPRMGQGANTKYKQKRNYGGGGSSFLGHSGTLKADGTQIQSNPLGRNKRTVWTIPTEPFPDAHFATFPRKLVEPMIKAGCPEFVCKKCGRARKKIYDRQIPPETVMTNNKQTDDKLVKTSANRYGKGQGQKLQNWLNEHPLTFKGYTDCGCGAGWRPGIVLDMFRRFRDCWRSNCKFAA